MSIYKKRTHHSIYRKIYEQHHGPIPKDSDGRTFEIHHIDGNADNNDPSNLVALSLRDHYDLHFSQGDFGACRLMIKQRLDLTPEEISEVSRLATIKRISDPNYINPWAMRPDGSSVSRDRVNNGSHHFLKRPDGTSVNGDKFANGTHPFQKMDFSGSKNPFYDHKIYRFENTVTNEVVTMTQNDFVKKYNLHQGHVSGLVRGANKSHKKWVFKGLVTDPV